MNKKKLCWATVINEGESGKFFVQKKLRIIIKIVCFWVLSGQMILRYKHLKQNTQFYDQCQNKLPSILWQNTKKQKCQNFRELMRRDGLDMRWKRNTKSNNIRN